MIRYFDELHSEFTPKTEIEYLKVSYIMKTETISKDALNELMKADVRRGRR